MEGKSGPPRKAGPTKERETQEHSEESLCHEEEENPRTQAEACATCGHPFLRQGKPEGGRYALLHAVVGGFLGDDYVVDVGFAEAGGGDAHEFAFFGEFFQGACADVAHAAFQAANKLIGETV